jgi:hypothetical protein
MKKRFILDLIIFILMFMVMLYDTTGGLWHEIIGIILFVLFIIHNTYNLSWIKNVTNKFNSMSSSIKIKYILDVILWLSFILCMISGILISGYLFKFNITSNIIYNIHSISSYVMFGTIMIHVLLHLKMISAFMKTKYQINEAFTNLVVVLILLTSSIIGFYNLTKKETVLSNDQEDTKDKSDNGTDNSSNDNSNGSNSNTTTPPVTLEEFLSQRHCGQCHNNCLLSAIRCGRGTSKVSEATSEYYATYGETSTTTTSNDLTYESDGTTYTAEI